MIRLLLAILMVATPTSISAQQTVGSRMDIVLRKPADHADVSESGGRTLIAVTSASGIGGINFTRKGDRWPAAITLRLNLRGLESIKIATGSTHLSGNYSSHGSANPISWALVSDGGRKETPIDRSNAYWLAIRAMNAPTRPATALPQEGGWFEVDIPSALLNGETTLTVDWIDFYR